MASEDQSDQLLAAYGAKTRQDAPPGLVRAISQRLKRSREILPRAVWACLVSSIGLAAITTLLLLIVGQPSPSDTRELNPPRIQELERGLFESTAQHPLR